MEEEQKVLTTDDKRKMLYYSQKVKKAFKLFVGDTHKDGDDLYIQKGFDFPIFWVISSRHLGTVMRYLG